MRTLMQALTGGGIRVQNFKAEPNAGVGKISHFGAYAVSAFFLGLGVLANRKSLPIKIDGRKLVSIGETLASIEQMSEKDWCAVDRLGQHICKDTSLLFPGGGQQKSLLNIYISQLLLNRPQSYSFENQVSKLFEKAGATVNLRIATRFMGPKHWRQYGWPACKSSYIASDNLAQMAEAAESIGQSLRHADLTFSGRPKMRKMHGWSNLAKFATSGIKILLNNSKQRSCSQIPSDASDKWRELVDFYQSMKLDMQPANGLAP